MKTQEQLEKIIITLNEILAQLPPSGFDEVEEIKKASKEIEKISVTIFEEFNKECIEFLQLNRTKQLLIRVSYLVVRCLSLVEYLEYSHSGLCNQ